MPQLILCLSWLDTFKENSTSYIDILLEPLIDANIPFATTFGNHDNHVNISHLAEINRIQQVAPLAYTRAAPGSVGGKGGEGNYWVPVYADPKCEAAITCADFVLTCIVSPSQMPNPHPMVLRLQRRQRWRR